MFDLSIVSYGTIVAAIRFLGALWASVGLAFFCWGMINYLFSHGNIHHKHDAQHKISEGFVILFSFTLVWALFRVAFHFL